jgi:hypothetical protein
LTNLVYLLWPEQEHQKKKLELASTWKYITLFFMPNYTQVVVLNPLFLKHFFQIIENLTCVESYKKKLSNIAALSNCQILLVHPKLQTVALKLLVGRLNSR